MIQCRVYIVLQYIFILVLIFDIENRYLTFFFKSLIYFQPQLVKVILTGVFKQVAEVKNPPIRSFMRSFIIIPVGEGVCISNELLFVSNATVGQVQKAFKTSIKTDPAPSEFDEKQIQLINEFEKVTGMLPQYCVLCLQQNNWDYAKAGEMFMQMKNENKIPAEYYKTS